MPLGVDSSAAFAAARLLLSDRLCKRPTARAKSQRLSVRTVGRRRRDLDAAGGGGRLLVRAARAVALSEESLLCNHRGAAAAMRLLQHGLGAGVDTSVLQPRRRRGPPKRRSEGARGARGREGGQGGGGGGKPSGASGGAMALRRRSRASRMAVHVQIGLTAPSLLVLTQPELPQCDAIVLRVARVLAGGLHAPEAAAGASAAASSAPPPRP